MMDGSVPLVPCWSVPHKRHELPSTLRHGAAGERALWFCRNKHISSWGLLEVGHVIRQSSSSGLMCGLHRIGAQFSFTGKWLLSHLFRSHDLSTPSHCLALCWL